MTPSDVGERGTPDPSGVGLLTRRRRSGRKLATLQRKITTLTEHWLGVRPVREALPCRWSSHHSPAK